MNACSISLHREQLHSLRSHVLSAVWMFCNLLYQAPNDVILGIYDLSALQQCFGGISQNLLIGAQL